MLTYKFATENAAYKFVIPNGQSITCREFVQTVASLYRGGKKSKKKTKPQNDTIILAYMVDDFNQKKFDRFIHYESLLCPDKSVSESVGASVVLRRLPRHMVDVLFERVNYDPFDYGQPSSDDAQDQTPKVLGFDPSMTEEQRISALMQAASIRSEYSHFETRTHKRPRTTKLHENYECHNCYQIGDHVRKECPFGEHFISKSTGTPVTFLKLVASGHKEALAHLEKHPEHQLMISAEMTDTFYIDIRFTSQSDINTEMTDTDSSSQIDIDFQLPRCPSCLLRTKTKHNAKCPLEKYSERIKTDNGTCSFFTKTVATNYADAQKWLIENPGKTLYVTCTGSFVIAHDRGTICTGNDLCPAYNFMRQYGPVNYRDPAKNKARREAERKGCEAQLKRLREAERVLSQPPESIKFKFKIPRKHTV